MLSAEQGVANMVKLGGLSLRDAVQTATVNPARIINLEGRMNGLQEGERGLQKVLAARPYPHPALLRRARDEAAVLLGIDTRTIETGTDPK